jgi:23S rRNA pseudouridine1911/1915/1917 synthase
VPEPAATNATRPPAIRVAHVHDGLRLDFCLARSLPEHSRVFFQRLLRSGAIRRNGQPSRPAEEVHTNDLIEIDWPEDPRVTITAENIPLDILAEDEDIIVLNKPPGLVVHPAQGNRTGTLVHGLLYHDEEQFGELLDEDLRPGIVHRLDKDTSGVMVVARNQEAWRAMKRAFREREVEKTYLALVLGEFGAMTGRIETLIGRHPRQRMKMAVVAEHGKHAATRYRVLGAALGVTLVQVQIETGRTHQIRVHFAHLRHPVLGDPLYGGRQRDAPIAVPRQMLHAWKLAFPHPRTGVMREYMGALPEDFQQALADLGLPPIGRRAAAGPAQPVP